MADSEEPEQSANVCIKSRKRKSTAPNLLQNHTSGAKGIDSIERSACASDPRQDRSFDVYRRWVSSSSSSSAPVLFPSESEIDLGRARIPSRGGLTNKTLNSGVPSAEKVGSVCGESSERWWLKEGFLEDEKGRKKNKVSSTTSVGDSSVSRMALSPPARDRSSPHLSASCTVEDPPGEENRSWVKRFKVMNYSRPNSFPMARSLQERHHLQNSMLRLPEQDSVADSWIQRWQRKDTQPVEEEGHAFPSLAAMALVGKAITKFRPCKFQRRGSSLVWSNEDL